MKIVSSGAGRTVEDRNELISAVNRQLHEIRPYLLAHFGDVELESLDDEGNLKVKFTGACAGCPAQPVTFGATVAPILEAIPGVASVSRTGSISKYAEARIRKYFGSR